MERKIDRCVLCREPVDGFQINGLDIVTCGILKDGDWMLSGGLPKGCMREVSKKIYAGLDDALEEAWVDYIKP